MRALIDADILVYQAAHGGENTREGEEEVYSFEYVESLLLKAILEITSAVGADSYTLYLTGDNNFRNDVAVTKPYKGNRVKPKPFHYKNVRAYLMSLPETIMTEGIEADDAMSMAQMEVYNYWGARGFDNRTPEECCDTVICTRDKDLRMVPGWHYGWEHARQPEYEMKFLDEFGQLEYNAEKNKITGTGLLFFYSQLITGDSVDNIPGLPKKGPKAAYVTLQSVKDEEEAKKAVYSLYKETIGESWKEYLLEQGQLLWMVREVCGEGNPIMWRPDEG